MNRKLLLRLILFALLPSAAAAQFTTVSGTVTDPNGLAYAYGTITPLLVASGTPTFTSTGSVYIPPTQPIGLDRNGSFTAQLANAASLTPGATTWKFTVCSALGTVQPAFGKGPVCFTVSGITISGSTQSLTSTLTAAAVALTANFGSGGAGVGTLSGDGTLFNNSSSTGAVTLAAVSLAANSLFGNPTASSATGVLVAFPSCSSANQAINWTAGTGPGCVTITGGSGANTAMSNLTSVAVNSALSPGTDNSISLDGLSNRYINFWASGAFGWTNGSGTADTGLSRDSAGVIDIGNGTAGDTSGTLKAKVLQGSGSNGGYVGVQGTGANVAFAASSSGFYPDSVSLCIHLNFNGVDVKCAAALGATETFTAQQTFSEGTTFYSGISNPSGTPTGTPATTGGTVPAANYFAKIVALDSGTRPTVPGSESAQVTTTTGTSTITWNWTAVTGASSYQIWIGNTIGSEAVFFTSNTNSFTQTLPLTSAVSTGFLTGVNSTGGPVLLGGVNGATIFPVGSATLPSLCIGSFQGMCAYALGSSNNIMAFRDQTGAANQVASGIDDEGMRLAVSGAIRFMNGGLTTTFDACLVDDGNSTHTLAIASAATGTGNCGAPTSNQVTGNLSLTKLNVFGLTSGNATLSASATGGTLNVGSTNVTVDLSGNIISQAVLYFLSTSGPNVEAVNTNVGEFCIGTTCSAGWGSSGVKLGSTGVLIMTNGALTGTSDTGISRSAAGVVAIGSGSAASTTGQLKASAYQSVGTTFTSSAGCSETTLLGGGTAGSYHSGTAGTCTTVITFGDSDTAPHGWACVANDLTTTTDVIKQTATTTTTVTLSGTTASGDVINFYCHGY